jgi:hypothetical protein
MPRFTEYDYHAEVPSAYANYMTLAAAMVERAVEDIGTAQRYIETNIHWREDHDVITLGKRAWHWLTMPHDGQRGISFAFLCDAMNVDLDHAQDLLIDGVPDRVIDVLERQVVLKVRKKQSPRKANHVGANKAKTRGNSDRRHQGKHRRNPRRPGAAGD